LSRWLLAGYFQLMIKLKAWYGRSQWCLKRLALS